MELWYCSNVTHARMEGLVKRGPLRKRTDTMEWLVPSHEEVPMPTNGYIITFAPFHERGLVIPSHPFFRGCYTTTRLSCSTSIPTGSNTSQPSSRVQGVPRDQATL